MWGWYQDQVDLVEIGLTNYSRKWRRENEDENTPPVSNTNTKRLLVRPLVGPKDYNQEYQYPSQ